MDVNEFLTRVIVMILAIALLVGAAWFALWIGDTWGEKTEDPFEDFNGSLYTPPKPEVNLSCPACPDCVATASCSSRARLVEACHIPERFFNRPSTFKSYSGRSNIPTLFRGNVLETVGIGEKDTLLAGCFYGFDYEGEEYLHRLAGIYADYLMFQGDNNDAFERVDRDAVKYLLLGVMYR